MRLYQKKMFIFAILIYQLHGEQNSVQSSNQSKQQAPVIFNVSVNTANKAHVDQKNNLDQQAHHLSQQHTNVKTSVDSNNNHNVLEKLSEFCLQESKKIHDNSTSFLTWIDNNKFKSCCMSLLLAYSYLSYKIYTENLIINDSNSWCNWHNGTSLEDLFQSRQESLESDLLFAIQTQYVHPDNPTDFIYSIVQSSISLKKEIEIIHNQIIRYAWIEKCRCLPLFFIETKDIEFLKERHRKLLFMQHLLASWCARYKIDKNN